MVDVAVAVFMLLVNFAILGSTLHTYINSEGIFVKFFPFQFQFKFYSWNKIHALYIRKYSPVREYGGWGIRISMNASKAYIVTGNTGLQLVLTNDKKMLIGTNRPDHLTNVLIKLGKMNH